MLKYFIKDSDFNTIENIINDLKKIKIVLTNIDKKLIKIKVFQNGLHESDGRCGAHDDDGDDANDDNDNSSSEPSSKPSSPPSPPP